MNASTITSNWAGEEYVCACRWCHGRRPGLDRCRTCYGTGFNWRRRVAHAGLSEHVCSASFEEWAEQQRRNGRPWMIGTDPRERAHA